MRRLLLSVLLLSGVTALQASDDGLTEQQAQGKVLFEMRCNLCHQLPEPDMLPPHMWMPLLQLMQKRMQQADMAPLNDEEFTRLHSYLTSQLH